MRNFNDRPRLSTLGDRQRGRAINSGFCAKWVPGRQIFMRIRGSRGGSGFGWFKLYPE